MILVQKSVQLAVHSTLRQSIFFLPGRITERRVMSDSNPFSTLLNQQTLTARLAILKPADSPDAPIEIGLTDAALKDTSYECISYDRSSRSSTADETVTVSVNGEDLAIPKALESALRTLRRKERPRTLWADLLVGRTVEERSAQAGVLRYVLENAERTLCWLGPGKGEITTKAFETISEMARRFEEACQQVGIKPDTSLTRATMQQIIGLREKLLDCPHDDLNSFDFAHWREIYSVFGASYWRSVQCISEIVLAKALIVVCGRGNIRWHSYIASSRAMPLYQAQFFKVPLLPSVMKGFEIANSIEIAERRRRLGESIELLPMIQTARECGAADPRENVFSMLPITTPSARIHFHNAGPQPLPIIDYSKTPQQVFAEAAKYSILERQDLMLWYNERPPRAKRIKGLPSWVPDFSALPPKNNGSFNPNGGMRAWWDNIQPASAKKLITVSSPSDGKPALHLQAQALDRIVHVSPIFDAGNARRLCFTEFQKLVQEMPTSTSGTSTNTSINETIEQRNERFWRTLILNAGGDRAASNTLRDNAPPPAEFHLCFESLLAEETILGALGCTPNELQTPENRARLVASAELSALVPRCGRALPFEELLTKHAAGRRFFRTLGGRFGMGPVEDVVAADGTQIGEDNELGGGDRAGETAAARRPNLGRLMNDPLARNMLESFQVYLNERDPNAARAAAQIIRGGIPGLPEEDSDGALREGDLVVACVGGFFPYALRPLPQAQVQQPEAEERRAEEHGGSSSATESLDDSSTYEFLGECYLHRAMDGEDFQARGFLGRKYVKIDNSKLVDITIV
ncbi:hypothetical protein GGR54DRAFT_608865 [Hypoxylon sp. NC1633]|nr:hypothetical protein GGR54DRAFT_608865 [Hypoxylon sp. NC1633]